MSDNSVTRTGDDANRDAELESVIADYIRAGDAGQRPDRQQILEQHPELANDLREFFVNRDRMDQLAQPFAQSVPPYDKSTLIRSEAEQVGACIGPYTLIQKLGEGGMGEVWVAKQSEPVKRKVALKLIKRGMDSKDVLARFEQERQALAMMDHPNIAKVFDGGVVGQAFQPDGATPSQAGKPDLQGQPYFVMELVNGLPLTKFCDEVKLTPRQRMELFVPICQAVQHAHQKGIVHRDLKPSNILVTIYDGQPVPKVIDFGVAKATGGKLTDESLSTQFGAVVGTLEYMSPEQAGFSGQDIDTRADIYSLGVILYELLTGLRPFDGQRLRKAALTELIRIIQEEEPSKPSTRLSSDASLPSLAALRQTEPKRLTALLRGELDWVVMKCLEKTRDRRYETVNGLARDIQRYLADEPVEARPPSASYRFSKFLRRHKGPVLAASLVLLALIGGIIGTSWGLMREAKQRQLAETNEGKANEAAKKERIAKDEERIAKDKAVAAAIEERNQRERADQNAKLALRRLYIADMNLAQAAWDDVRVARVRQLLEQHGPDANTGELRGFEWFYWNRLCQTDASEHPTLKGSNCVAFSTDGFRIATAGPTVKIWDARSGLEILALKGGAKCVAFSPVNSQIATAGTTLKVWDAVSGNEILTLKGHAGPVTSVAFSSDGAHIVSASEDKTVKVWSAATGHEKLTLNGHRSAVASVAFSPERLRIVSGSHDHTLKLWDAGTGQELQTLRGHWDTVASVAFSPDGSRIASASDDQTVKVWDSVTGKETLTLRGHTSLVASVAFSADGLRLASCGYDQTVKIWDALTGHEAMTLRGHTGIVWSVAMSPDGARIASASDDQIVKLWDAVNGPESVTLKGHTGAVDAVAFSSDGMRLASVCRHGTVRLWDVPTGRLTATLKGHTNWVRTVAFSPNGKQVASASDDQTLKLWDAATGQELLTLKGAYSSSYKCNVAFSPDNEWLACAGGPNTVTLWNIATGEKVLTLKGHKSTVTSVAFRPDGKQIATASIDATVKLWDSATGQETRTLKGHKREVSSVGFSSDGLQLASASQDGTVKLWNAITGQETATLKGHTEGVECVTFSPDGMRVASASSDQTVKLWDSSTGQEVITFRGLQDVVTCVSFSPEGSRLAAPSRNNVKLWHAPRNGVRSGTP